jgi:RNA polymerase sigma factor (sigma-70 family)
VLEIISSMDDLGSPQSTRPSLLMRIRDPRDSEAWQTFVDTYLLMIYRFGRRMNLQDADAADVSQEVLSEVARCIRTFEYQPEKGRFRDWLGTLVRRKVTHFLKKNNRGLGVEASDQPDELESVQADSEWTEEFNTQILTAAIERARPNFAPSTWRAFERVWLENQRASDVAAELQIPIEMVYTAKSRALKRLEDEVRILAEDVPMLSPQSRTR